MSITTGDVLDQNIVKLQKIRPKIGLALGSGGVRGFAHIGVIKVLEENNIPIDFIAGSSIGAIIGSFYACKKDIKEVEEIFTTIDFKKLTTLVDPGLKSGFIKGKKAENFFKDYLGEIKFSDLLIPFSAVVTDYQSGNAVVFSRGEVVPAIRASMSVPIAFKPVVDKEKIYVDGGLSVPVPVDIVRQMGADIVIAVNLDNDFFSYNKKSRLRLSKIAWNTINLLRHNLALSQANRAEIVINPRVGDIVWFDILNSQKALLAGEEAAKEYLFKIKNLLNIG